MFTSVMYHYVRDPHPRFPDIKARTVDEFRGQIQHIKQHYHVLTIKECLAALDGQQPLPPNGLLLTFDDGFVDHHESVFPILKEHGITGVFYPPGEALADGKVLDVHKIHFILAATTNVESLIEESFQLLDKQRHENAAIPSNEKLWEEYGVATRLDTKEVRFIKGLLQSALPTPVRKTITDQLFRQHVTVDEVGFAAELYLSRNQIEEMSDGGMEFGCHGWVHDWLDTMTEAEQGEEIDRGIEFLKSFGIWDPDTWTMCYPYGRFNEVTVELLKARDCKMAFTVEVELSSLDTPHRLARLDTNDLPLTGDAPTNKWFAMQTTLDSDGSAA